MNRETGDTEQLEYLYRGELDYPASASEAALYSSEDSMQGPDLVCDPEQLEYQNRPMTPGEKEIIGSYEDAIYRPPDMTEKSGSLQIKGFGFRPGRSCSLQTALHQPVVEAADSDLELEELLRDTLEPGTPQFCSPTLESPLTSGAARINPEAAKESAEDMEAVVDQLQAIVALVEG